MSSVTGPHARLLILARPLPDIPLPILAELLAVYHPALHSPPPHLLFLLLSPDELRTDIELLAHYPVFKAADLGGGAEHAELAVRARAAVNLFIFVDKVIETFKRVRLIVVGASARCRW